MQVKKMRKGAKIIVRLHLWQCTKRKNFSSLYFTSCIACDFSCLAFSISVMSAYLHCIGHRDLATCPNCNNVGKTVENHIARCPAHDQARKYTWLGDQFLTDPQHLWSFLEGTEAETNPPTRNKRYHWATHWHTVSVMWTISPFVIFAVFDARVL